MALRILVVDDATFVRDTIKRTVRRMIPEVEILEALDGKRAVSLMKTNQVDIILSDWEMPEMTGEEFLAWVRSNPKYIDTPFIMVSSRGDRNHVVLAVNAGVSDYLTKPFTADELEKKLLKQLKKIAYTPPKSKATTASSGFGSTDVLTAGVKNAHIDKSKKGAPKREVKSPAGAKARVRTPATAIKTGNFQGKAWLRFPKENFECQIRELSLQAMNGVMSRPEKIPALFDQVAVDLEDAQGAALARLNAYVHSMSAAENNPATDKIRISVRFVDDDPQKLETLSKAIAQ